MIKNINEKRKMGVGEKDDDEEANNKMIFIMIVMMIGKGQRTLCEARM